MLSQQELHVVQLTHPILYEGLDEITGSSTDISLLNRTTVRELRGKSLINKTRMRQNWEKLNQRKIEGP